MARRIAFPALVLALLALLASPAWAHVTIAPDSADKGASDQEIAFRVPNEEQTPTTKIQISIPTDHPLLGVLAQPVPGWTAKVTTVKLAKPIHTDDGDIADAVSEVDWTANSAATGIPVGDFQRFEIIVGLLPSDTGTITFPAIQTYSNGDVVKWIQIQLPGGPAPDKPAPVLTLTKAGATATPTTQPASTPTATASTVKKSDVDSARTLGIVGIVVGALGLLAAGAALARGRRAG